MGPDVSTNLVPLIHIISAFRNAEGRLDRYFSMVEALHASTPFVRVQAIVGDSTDLTGQRLDHWAQKQPRDHWWFRYDHGGPEYGSTEEPARLTALSGLLNAGLEESRRYLTDDDVVIWMEGDLYWDPLTILQLARFLRRPEVDVVAPMVFAGEAFYDTWAFRTLDYGHQWGPFWPWGYHADFTSPASLVEMGSVGSCVAMKARVAKTIRVEDNYALVGWCRAARAAGHRIWCAKNLRVHHPFDLRT